MTETTFTQPLHATEHHGVRLPRGAVLAVASIAQFMVVLDVTIASGTIPVPRVVATGLWRQQEAEGTRFGVQQVP
jgi:hypothetical protein